MKVPVKITSKITGKVVEALVSVRDLLDTYEDDLVSKLTECDCQPVGETNVVDCNCYDEWDDYELLIGDEVNVGSGLISDSAIALLKRDLVNTLHLGGKKYRVTRALVDVEKM